MMHDGCFGDAACVCALVRGLVLWSAAQRLLVRGGARLELCAGPRRDRSAHPQRGATANMGINTWVVGVRRVCIRCVVCVPCALHEDNTTHAQRGRHYDDYLIRPADSIQDGMQQRIQPSSKHYQADAWLVMLY